uniref:Uncharacterized protein n=1 Tax=Anguilla anguilla TaxID=7936 RepID=A0A0E9X284_ANGAN
MWSLTTSYSCFVTDSTVNYHNSHICVYLQITFIQNNGVFKSSCGLAIFMMHDIE